MCEVKQFFYSINFEQDLYINKELIDFKGSLDGKDKNKNSKTETKVQWQKFRVLKIIPLHFAFLLNSIWYFFF